MRMTIERGVNNKIDRGGLLKTNKKKRMQILVFL